MKKAIATMIFTLLVSVFLAADDFEVDIVPVVDGEVAITLIGHGTLMFEYNGIVIHIDPVLAEADYTLLPDADLILVTHEHRDHLDLRAIREIRSDTTVVIHNRASSGKIDGGRPLSHGESNTVRGILIEAVPAYNTTKGRSMYHPQGRDNGYILTMGEKRFYVAGDTEDIPEMLLLEDIYVAFLPANQPYTMRPEQVARAAKAFRPAILYPYHFNNTDVSKIEELLADEEDIEVRIRDMR